MRVVEDPDEVGGAAGAAGRPWSSRDELVRSNPDFDAVSPQAGELDAAAIADLAARDPDAAARVLAGRPRSFDPGLRAAARTLAARLPLGRPRVGAAAEPGTRRVVTRREPTGSDVTSTPRSPPAARSPTGGPSTCTPAAGGRPAGRSCCSWTRRARWPATSWPPPSSPPRRWCSGCGRATSWGWSRLVDGGVLRPLSADPRVDVVVDRLCDLRGGGTTDLELALRTAAAQMARSRAADRQVLLLSDGIATDSPDPVNAASALARIPARLQVLALSGEDEAMASCTALAAAGGGRVAALHRPSQAPAAVRELLG